MLYGSVCSGIESASMAWEPLGMLPAWFAEVEAFPSAVLAHHWPHVANYGDMCNLPYLVSTGIVSAPDILVGGTPCQAFSVAGLREGLEDERGQLTLKFVEIANEIDKKRSGEECVVVWENVPGVLSSKDNAFGCFLGALAGEECELKPAGKKWSNAGLVYGPERAVAWRVLDAQYFGVAQRRRRVFVVASARKGFDPGAVLFERKGLRRDIAPSRKTKAEASEGVRNGSHWGSEQNAHPTLNQSHNTGGIGASNQEVFSQRGAGLVKGFRMAAFGEYSDDETATDLVTCFDSRQDPNVYGDLAGPCSASYPPNAVAHVEVMPTMVSGGSTAASHGKISGQFSEEYIVPVCFHQNASGELRESELSYTLNTNSNASGRNTALVRCHLAVRRLTPTECERLQGFPDNHTRIAWKNKSPEDCPDGPRYKAIGNSKAVPVIRFIGKRIIKELNKNA